MSRSLTLGGAAWRTVLFLVLVPGSVAGWIPAWLSVQPGPRATWLFRTEWHLLGVVPILAGSALLFVCAMHFVHEGRGTPSPTHETATLVTGGLYQWTRNPMYLGVASMLVGHVLLSGSGWVALYAVGVLVAFVAFVRQYEEPRLERKYGDAYRAYCARVPRWMPRRPAR